MRLIISTLTGLLILVSVSFGATSTPTLVPTSTPTSTPTLTPTATPTATVTVTPTWPALTICAVCDDDGTVIHPIIQCAESGCNTWVCLKHSGLYTGKRYCPWHYRAHIQECFDDCQTFVQDKIDNPPTLASFDDVEDEMDDSWEQLKQVIHNLRVLHNAIIHGTKQGNLYPTGDD